MQQFSKILKELQEQNKGYIVLIKNGIFYCGIGKDAVLMNQILNYKPVCFKENICKCGIPVSTLSRVIPKMVETGYSYIIYDYNKETGEYKEIYRIEGHEVYEANENINCNLCWYKRIKDKNEKEYIQDFEKMIKEEIDERKYLNLIPKYQEYIQYMIEVIIKLPRTEKFSIGNEFKKSMYETIENILYVEKVDKYKRLYYLNLIDAKINTQRILLRIMLKNKLSM